MSYAEALPTKHLPKNRLTESPPIMRRVVPEADDIIIHCEVHSPAIFVLSRLNESLQLSVQGLREGFGDGDTLRTQCTY